jgi:hypothetical protein
VILFFCERYKTKYGQPPQVLKKHAGALAKIVARYGEVEGARRTAILFDSPPLFLASTPPDLGTLVQHWDKLVAASGGPSGTARSPIGRAEPASATQHAADAAKGAVPWA